MLSRKSTFRLIRFLALLALISSLSADAAFFHLSASKQALYSSKLEGKWKVITEVVWSDCPYVKVGESSESLLSISSTNGRLYPQWKAKDWEIVRNNAISFGVDDSLHWERENKLFKGGDYWFIEASDEFAFDKHDQLKGRTTIYQYLNGEYVGSYVSRSRLERVDEHDSIASDL